MEFAFSGAVVDPQPVVPLGSGRVQAKGGERLVIEEAKEVASAERAPPVEGKGHLLRRPPRGEVGRI